MSNTERYFQMYEDYQRGEITEREWMKYVRNCLKGLLSEIA